MLVLYLAYSSVIDTAVFCYLRTGVNKDVCWFPCFVIVKDLEAFFLSGMPLCKTRFWFIKNTGFVHSYSVRYLSDSRHVGFDSFLQQSPKGASNVLVLWELLAQDGNVPLPSVIGGDIHNVGVVAFAFGYLSTGPWCIKVRCAQVPRKLRQ